MLHFDLNSVFNEIGGEMKLEDILILSEKKLSGLDMMLYYCLKQLSIDNNMPSMSREFNELGTPILENKEVKKPKCGIYKIYNNSKVYVGQSKNIQERWKTHKQKMTRDIHPYFKKQEIGQVSYEILEECKMSELGIKENLWAQRLKDKDLKIANEENFTLI